ncbi:MAG: cytochrome c biogenesis protein ResB [Prevotella sp.]|nr:cytochrome c biogenesis protein ResB [Prevotella sp.]
MWTKPWRMTEGFVIGGGLIVAGLMLELSTGAVDWDAFRWPVNAIVLACFVIFIVAMALAARKVYAFRFLSTYAAAVPAITYAVVLTIIMGLTRQTADGRGVNNMLTFWPFVLIYVYLAVILGMAVVKRLRHLSSWRRDVPFLLNHLGLFIALTCATLGNADMQRLRMIISEEAPEWRAIDTQQHVVELPLAIQLERFIMEEYDDGTPRRFASDIQVLTKSGSNIHTTVDVNKPVVVEGWKIYQFGYNTAMGKDSRVSILELVSDPWLNVVYTGIGMMLLGAVSMFLLGVRREQA